MSAEILDAIDGTITLEITGRLTPGELASAHTEASAHLKSWNGGNLLVLAERFQGWSGDGWSNLDFQTAVDPLIRKMAIVGDKRWEELALLFTAKGLRPFPIEYFASHQESEARAWLKA